MQWVKNHKASALREFINQAAHHLQGVNGWIQGLQRQPAVD